MKRRHFLQSTAAGSAGIAVATNSQAAPSDSGKNAPVIEADVLVCGGGCAGTAAALSAARKGVKTLLIEKAPFAGGIITSVGLPFFDGIADIRDNRIIVRGIALELLAKTGVCKPDATHTEKHNPTIPSTFEFKVLLDRELTKLKDNLTTLFNSFACDVISRDGRINEVLVANKDGLVRVRPKVVVDCTGDADIATWSGAPTEQSAEVQPLTLHFRIGHVQKNQDLTKNCRAALAKAQEAGELPMYYGPGIMFKYANDEIYIHSIRVPANPTSAADLTRAEMQGRSDVLAMFTAWKRDVPGFEDAYLIEAYPWIGVRESRRLVGQHVLNEKDIMDCRRFDDAITTGCWYLDLHPNKVTVGSANDFQPEKVQPKPYDIPFRSLLPQKIENLLVAGRCHSATRGAHASTRVTVTAMAMGEAAGLAAAMSVEAKKSAQEIEGPAVRATLRKQNAGPQQDWS